MSATSDSTDPVTATVELLEGVDTSLWSLDPPDTIQKRHESTPQGRENNPNPALYAWSPVDADLSQVDAEGSLYDETRTIEVEVWTLDYDNTYTYQQDVIEILRGYSNDNHASTEFHHIRPNSVSDFRQEAVARRTDHFVMSVQAEVRRLR